MKIYFKQLNNFLLIVSLLCIAQYIVCHDHIMLTNPKKSWCNFFKHLHGLYTLDTFVESGTYFGDTTAQAAMCFPFVHSIELSENFYNNAVIRFKQDTKVSLHQGDSTNILPALLPSFVEQKKRVLFWLDGHYFGQGTALGDSYSPILEELTAIKNSRLKNSIILIDDIRLLGTLLFNNRIPKAGNPYYPLLDEVCKVLDHSDFSYILMGDILLAYDKSIPLTFSPLIHACTMSRLYDGNNFDVHEVIKAEQLIGTAQGQELQSIQELYKDFCMTWKAWSNKSPHYNLWCGLTLSQAGDYENACQQFNEVINLGYDHWRIFWYLAQSFYQNKNFTNAKEVLTKVLTINPHFEPAKILLEKVNISKPISFSVSK